MPNPTYQFRLKISGPGGNQVFTLPIGVTTTGRQVGNQLLLNDSLVSRSHARFDCTTAECQVTDLGSANGSTLNGERLTPNVPYPLVQGSRLKIGPFELIVEAEPTTTAGSQRSIADIPIDLSPVESVEPEPTPPEPPAEAPQEKPAEVVPEIQMKVEDLPIGVSVGGSPVSPPVSPPPPSEPPETPISKGEPQPIPGLPGYSTRLVNYLPGIYQTDFMSRFLGIFESLLVPLEWSVDNFDLFLSPGTSPSGFLPWLQSWYGIVFHPSWSDEQRRQFLLEAHQIYASRGTRKSLSRVLEIYTGRQAKIIDDSEEVEPHTFLVRFQFKKGQFHEDVLQSIIDGNKPAHTTYMIEYVQK